jgi:uncharacterized membrane protein
MRFIIPNYHVILIHFPLGLLGVGVLIELFSFLWRRSSFHTAGRWMILFGTLMTVPAVTSGIFALYDVVGHGEPGGAWYDVKSSSGFGDQDWHLLRNHVLFTSVGSGIALVAVVLWLGASDLGRRRLRFLVLIALLAAMGLFASGAWHGGEMVYRQGFGVDGRSYRL